ncbi:hypothetical protein B0H17DRAFT_1199969 [Mycena rosella]|uniref:Uncharacterized protein n=1 Tax=Mycena rosella TaxID=1033263 RepID=A0AAD7GKD5_MYCRO|nr:hypothetical protein B0H17DRAFT_1199969 [Mycena rosella]
MVNTVPNGVQFTDVIMPLPGGVEFAVQDSVVFFETLCTASQNPIAGRFDVAVRVVQGLFQ